MPPDKQCSVPGCGKKLIYENVILHGFPNPEKEPDRFETCAYAVGGAISLDNNKIYKYRNVCREHYEKKYQICKNRFTANYVPTLSLKDFKVARAMNTGNDAYHPPTKQQTQEVIGKDPLNKGVASRQPKVLCESLNAATLNTDIAAKVTSQTNYDIKAEKLSYDGSVSSTITANKTDKPIKQQRQIVTGKDKINRPEAIDRTEAEQFGNDFHNEKFNALNKSTYTMDSAVANDVEMTEMSIYVDNDDYDDYALCIDSAQTDDGKVPVIRNLQHDNISCNECHEDIHGYRYVCLECVDYDLCSACEARGVHDTHYVLRIPEPRPQKEISDLLKSLRDLIFNARCPTNVENEDDSLSIKEEDEEEIEMDNEVDAMESASFYLHSEDDPLTTMAACMVDQPTPALFCTNERPIPSLAVAQETDTQPATKSTSTDYDSALNIITLIPVQKTEAVTEKTQPDDLYRKCAKCGALAAHDNSVRYHNFPKLRPKNILRLAAWATYCWPSQDWSSVESLTAICQPSKIICSRHFQVSCYNYSDKARLNSYSIPGSKEDVTKILRSLRSKIPLSAQQVCK